MLAAVPYPVSYFIQDKLLADQAPPSMSAVATKRNTKLIGDLSELRVALALVDAGYAVSKPLGENCRYDLIADDGDRLHRVQVKTGRLRNGVIRFNCSSSHAHRGGKMRPYFGQVEYLAVYCPDTLKVYLLPEQELTASVAHLRVSPTGNSMAKRIRWAAKYELA